MKRLELYGTKQFNEEFSQNDKELIAGVAINCFTQYKCDMFVFESICKNSFQVRLAGYSFNDNQLDEETVACKSEGHLNRNFWFKIDDYGNKFVGTFLFPDEY